MAMSNRDRVGRGLEILAAGLGPFVDARMSAPRRPAGTGWRCCRPGTGEHGRERQYSSPIRVPAAGNHRGVAAVQGPAVAGRAELRQRAAGDRNRWAHGDAFTADDTYRALDTMERLLAAADAAEQAAEVRKLRLDGQRAAIEAETRGRSARRPGWRASG